MTTNRVVLLLIVTQGIRERMDFLHDMESLGMGKKYRPIIQQEIAQKIRLIESLDSQTSGELRKEICELEHERSSAKLFPLTEPGENWFSFFIHVMSYNA